ncbi:MAG: sensor histidine kinase [Leptolyngbya sp. SIO4C1]|nr:sensor histidine kinase [Leptolyngbya sp. SIO4C1]
MNRPIQYQNHPFRFLLYLEWTLLAIAIMGFLAPAPPSLVGPVGLRPPPQFPLISLSGIFLFGLLGLSLPTGRLMIRIGHTALQVLLIGVTSLLGVASGRLFPFMYLVLVIRSCFMFGLMGRVVTTGLSFLLFLMALQVRIQLISLNLPPRAARRLHGVLSNVQLNLIFLFGIAVMFILLLVNALLTERQSQENLRQTNLQLKQSAQAIERLAMAQERSRIAREIHDSLGHSLTALNIQLEGALKLSQKDPPRSQAFLTEAKRLGSVALQDVRQSVATLRRNPLQGQSLAEAVSTLAENVRQATGMQLTTELQIPEPLPEPLRVALYRIAQEGLTNLVKHAGATAARLQITSQAHTLTLSLIDDGRGFDTAQTSTGYGLQGMRERAEAAGGQFMLTSQPGQGSHLQVTLPIAADDSHPSR